MNAGTAAGRVMVAGVIAGVVLSAASVPSWLYLVCAVIFGIVAWQYIQRETRRDVGGR